MTRTPERSRHGGHRSDSPSGGAVDHAGDSLGAVLDELRLDPEWSNVRAAAACQALARRLAECVGVSFDVDALSSISGQIWHDRGVSTREDLEVWMRERRLDDTRIRALVHSEAVRRWGADAVSVPMSQDLIDQLLLSAEYPRLFARAKDKHAQLAQRGLLDLPTAVDISYQDLLTWWARHRPHLAPSHLADDAEKDPFSNSARFRQAVINEYHYVTRCHDRAATTSEASWGGLCDAHIVSMPAPWSHTGTSAWDQFGDLDEFGCRYWDRAPLHRCAGAAFDATPIMSLEALDRLITSRHANVRLLDRGMYLGDEGHREGGLVRFDQRTWLSNPAALLGEFRSGRTIIVPSADELWPPIDVLASQLATLLDASVSAALWVTPSGSSSDWHADTTHVVALQLYGTKRWLVERDGPGGTAQVNPPLDVTLRPGDVLYVPLRFMHRVQAHEGLSVHITFSCSTTTWSELAKAALAVRFDAGPEEWVHRSLINPNLGPASKALWSEQLDRLIDALQEAMEGLDADALASSRAAHQRRHSSQEGAFLKTCDALSVTSRSVVRIRPGLRVLLEERPDALELRFDDRCVHLPTWLSPALERLLDTPDPLEPSALPLDPADAIVLVRRLVAEGLLEVYAADTGAP